MQDDAARQRDDSDPSLLLKAFVVLVVGFSLIVSGVVIATRGVHAAGGASRIQLAPSLAGRL